jgi:hypothetical protein
MSRYNGHEGHIRVKIFGAETHCSDSYCLGSQTPKSHSILAESQSGSRHGSQEMLQTPQRLMTGQGEFTQYLAILWL